MSKKKNGIAFPPGSSSEKAAPEKQIVNGTIKTYEELQRQISDDLRHQNPQWIQADGSSPICDFYQKRLAELLAFLRQRDNWIEIDRNGMLDHSPGYRANGAPKSVFLTLR
jgi:hypothetical protein